MKLTSIIVGWVVYMVFALIFYFLPERKNTEPDETSHTRRYKYTHPDDDEHVILEYFTKQWSVQKIAKL